MGEAYTIFPPEEVEARECALPASESRTFSCRIVLSVHCEKTRTFWKWVPPQQERSSTGLR